VYAHALVRLWFADLHAFISLARLVVRTCVVLVLGKVIASTLRVFDKSRDQSSTVLLALGWRTADRFASTLVSSVRYVLVWLTDFSNWARLWCVYIFDEADSTLGNASLLVALVAISKPLIIVVFWHTLEHTVASSGCTSLGVVGGSTNIDTSPLCTNIVTPPLWKLFTVGSWWASWLFWAAFWAWYTLSVSATATWASCVIIQRLVALNTVREPLTWVKMWFTWWLWNTRLTYAVTLEATSVEVETPVDAVNWAGVTPFWLADSRVVVNLGIANVCNVFVQAVTYTLGTMCWKSELIALFGGDVSWFDPVMALWM
jgi:hypothetical protein